MRGGTEEAVMFIERSLYSAELLTDLAKDILTRYWIVVIRNAGGTVCVAFGSEPEERWLMGPTGFQNYDAIRRLPFTRVPNRDCVAYFCPHLSPGQAEAVAIELVDRWTQREPRTAPLAA